MPNTQEISIFLTVEQLAALEDAVATGEYANPSEIVQEALSEWQQNQKFSPEQVVRLRQLWDEGLRSGTSTNVDLEDVRQQALQRLNVVRASQPAHAR